MNEFDTFDKWFLVAFIILMIGLTAGFLFYLGYQFDEIARIQRGLL